MKSNFILKQKDKNAHMQDIQCEGNTIMALQINPPVEKYTGNDNILMEHRIMLVYRQFCKKAKGVLNCVQNHIAEFV